MLIFLNLINSLKKHLSIQSYKTERSSKYIWEAALLLISYPIIGILTLVSFPDRTHSVFLWGATGQWIWRGEIDKLLTCKLVWGAITTVGAGRFLLWAAPCWCRADPARGYNLCCPRTCDRGPRPCEGSDSRSSSAERRSGERCR